jgi:glycosyltransferase involved in cell wall biosynthesis
MDYPEAKSWYTRYLYNRRVDGVVAISRVIMNLLIEAGVEPDRIRLIHSGVDPQRFDRCADGSASTEYEAVVGIIASLEERKGHRYLLEAAAMLKRRGHKVRYLLAGEGPARDQLEDKVRALNLEDEVRFCGFVSDAPGFLSQIDIFILPSLYEGLGVAVLEAMAAECPIVTTDVPGCRDLISHEASGLLVPFPAVDALASAILRLLQDRPLASRLASRALEVVTNDWHLSNTFAAYASLYEEALSGSVQC